MLTVRNNIYFHDVVSTENITKLVNELNVATTYAIKNKIPNVHVFIQTDGGYVFAGFSGMRHIERNPIPVITHVDGWVASAGTFMFLGGHQRIMSKYSYMCIHQLRSIMSGKYSELVEETEICERVMRMMENIYKEKAEIPDRVFKKLMKKEMVLHPDECLEYKLTDAIE
jgi:ATP-dependent protease ClpP protease subunit